MTKQYFIDAHEELISELMEANPNMSWSRAYELTADSAYERMKDKLADMADELRDRAKYENP